MQYNYFDFRDVGFLSVTQRPCWQGGWWESLTSCNTHPLLWDVPRWSEMWITVWARGIQLLSQDILAQSQKEICCTLYKIHTHTHTLPPSRSAVTMLMPGPLWVCLALIWVRTCAAHSLFTCEPIRVHRCLGVPYNMTFFPNMMEHYDQDIAASNMEVSSHYIIYISVLIYSLMLIFDWLNNQSILSTASKITHLPKQD